MEAIATRVPAEVAAALEDHADELDTTTAEVARKILSEHATDEIVTERDRLDQVEDRLDQVEDRLDQAEHRIDTTDEIVKLAHPQAHPDMEIR